MARNYKKYIVYSLAYEIVLQLYKLTDSFPEHEKNNLISQIRRAAVSVPVNIAEGSAKRSSKEFLNFLNIAYASSTELAVLLSLSKDVGYVSEEEFVFIDDKIDEFNGKMFLFIRQVEKDCPTNFFQKHVGKV